MGVAGAAKLQLLTPPRRRRLHARRHQQPPERQQREGRPWPQRYHSMRRQSRRLRRANAADAQRSTALLATVQARALQLRASFTPTGLAWLLYSLARAGVVPPPEWLRAVVHRGSCAQLCMLSGSSLATLVWALGRLRFQPAPAWLDEAEALLEIKEAVLEPSWRHMGTAGLARLRRRQSVGRLSSLPHPPMWRPSGEVADAGGPHSQPVLT